MVEAFKTGDGVYMQNEEMDKVGEGTIVSILPSFTVQTVELGNCSFAVRLDKVLQCQHALPYPDMDATTLGEVEIGMTIRWPIHLLLVINEVNNDVISLEDCEGFVEEARVQCSQIPRTSSTTPVDYKLRQNWYLLEVHILIRTPAGDKLPVAEGLVTFTAPAASVNNTRLGELNVGIAVTNLSNGVDPEILRNTPLAAFVDGPMLVSWSLKLVIAKKFNRSLYSLQLGVNRDSDDDHQLSRDEGVDDLLEDTPSTSQPLLESGRPELPRRKKRHYNSTVRNTPDPLRRARIEAKKRASVQTTDEQIRGVQRTTCCGEMCCRKVTLEVIRRCRLEYFGLPHDEREEYIHTRLHMRHQTAIEEGKHIIDQKLICKKAFWTIYGFSKSKYYGMMGQQSKGVVMGYHGNQRRPKPRGNSIEADVVLRQLLGQLAEPMPHMQYIQADGSPGILYMLPSCYNKLSIMNELNLKLKSLGGKGISKSSFYKQWTDNFENFRFHQKGAFAKCDTCVELKLKLMEERRPEARRPIEEERNKHMTEQMSRRNVYYAKRTLAKTQPERYLCLIHDKMDQNKTNIPRLADNMKKLHVGGCIPLPISLTGMLTHGREPGAYCHLSVTGLWPGDPNFTVSSLARCLRDLEQMDDTGDHIGDLARTTSAVPLFTSLLDQAAFTASLGRQGATDSSFLPFVGNGNMQSARDNVQRPPFKPLPPLFMLQMDNSAKDNKNIHVLAFCSELVIRGVFETVEVNFLMVGHTHEDVDALFSKVSAQTINKDVLTLPALMAEIWDSETMHPVPLLLEEVADYKSYVDSCLRPLHFSPWVSSFQWQIMCQFTGISQKSMDLGFLTLDRHYGRKWTTNHGTGFTLAQRQQEATRDGPEDGIIVVDELQQEFHQENNLMLQPYVGDPANRPKRPSYGAVVREIDDEHHGQFLVEWWRPKHQKSNATNKERYLNVLAGQKDWEKDPGYFTPEWINATAAVYSWKYKSKEGVPQNARLNPLAKAAIESHFQQLDKENDDL
ncbi:hypothetical protein R1sor_009883 [Riccia sorocarpa]|uniref:DUF7869 domain-containing protein n=1 Tax=Riccia sorocarpa TaxID=122646 RepID=A0ABD3HWD1_9MARC